ncbi:MAG: sigma-70 region 4 domain-containing protein, partial [Lachnospiraceae bacterium]|nr:sigma-70 region 4 domain-containing protein [Lachnospiraceae bacterium]
SLRKLAPDYRAVLWLVYFENFSGKEAASILKKNDRQMKNLLYRAKQSLKSELEKEGFTYEEF